MKLISIIQIWSNISLSMKLSEIRNRNIIFFSFINTYGQFFIKDLYIKFTHKH